MACGYDLQGLDAPRCPECARPFDASDPRTYSPTRHRRKNLPALIGMYLVPLALNAALWISFVLTRGPSYGIYGMRTALRAIAGSGCGPLRLVLPVSFSDPFTLVYVVFAVLWGSWFTLLWRTRLGALPYSLHVVLTVLACIWWIIGTVIVGIGV